SPPSHAACGAAGGDAANASRRADIAEWAARGVCRGRLTSTRACFANQFLAIVIGAATAISPAAGQTRDSLARTDSAPKRPDSTRAPLRLCAGGDVTFGTNLDTLWAKKAARMLRAEFRQSSAPDSLPAPLKPRFAAA